MMIVYCRLVLCCDYCMQKLGHRASQYQYHNTLRTATMYFLLECVLRCAVPKNSKKVRGSPDDGLSSQAVMTALLDQWYTYYVDYEYDFWTSSLAR